MKFLLDTNFCIYVIKERPEKVFRKFRRLEVGQVAISSITYAELCFGVRKSRRPAQNESALQQFTSPLEIVPFSPEAALAYGEIRAELERLGKPIGPLDTLIAAHAKSLGFTLVTNNVAEFSRVPGLRIQNWA
ncbi:MAG: type II toxin-antitoxin system VapC family toxin [Opitutales bacterium]|nr:type II toxin-antitoxin system VapC family toxin [Opitutales bacterium]